MAAPVLAKAETLPDPATLGKNFPRYRPTLAFPGEFIDAAHRAIAELPAPEGLIVSSIEGYLRPADALTLYELAYFANGGILELGSAWGLSTSLLCRAAANAGRGSRVSSIELDPAFQIATVYNIGKAGLSPQYEALPGDADRIMSELLANGRRFSVVFIDHDHSYEPIRSACAALWGLLQPGGMALFHDFNDDRNLTPAGGYGIYRAVSELLQDSRMSFLGTIGCCALVRRVS